MDHNQERFAKDPEAAKMYRLITDFFLKELKLDFVTQEEIEHMIGVLLTNGFENEYEDVQGRAIYPHLSLASHSCQANLRHAVSPGHVVALQVTWSLSNVTNGLGWGFMLRCIIMTRSVNIYRIPSIEIDF